MRVFLLEDIEREVPVVTRIERYKAGEFYEIDDEFAMELIQQKKAVSQQVVISQLAKVQEEPTVEIPTEEPSTEEPTVEIPTEEPSTEEPEAKE